ncbi:MAG: iron donor protein CyaY [Burkholderiales bacterium]
MNETEFIRIADSILQQIAAAIDDADIDLESNFKGDGILEIESDHGAKLIVNRNTPIREIWLAAPTGGFHFRADGARWLDTRDGEELGARLSALLKSMIGSEISIQIR